MVGIDGRQLFSWIAVSYRQQILDNIEVAVLRRYMNGQIQLCRGSKDVFDTNVVYQCLYNIHISVLRSNVNGQLGVIDKIHGNPWICIVS